MQSLDRSSAIYATSYLPYLDLSHNASFPLFNTCRYTVPRADLKKKKYRGARSLRFTIRFDQ